MVHQAVCSAVCTMAGEVLGSWRSSVVCWWLAGCGVVEVYRKAGEGGWEAALAALGGL